MSENRILPKWKYPVGFRRIALASTDVQIQLGSPIYYAVCAFGGALACSTTHIATLPLDLIKCRMQADPTRFPTMRRAFKVTLRKEGVSAFARGWAATALGYGAQGVFRFGLYEYFKIKFAEMSSPETFYRYRTFIYLGAAASAEFIADIPLSPFEGIKVRMQTIPKYPTTFRHIAPHIWRMEGLSGMFVTLLPLWGRQIPYTMVKFTTFERTLEFLYNKVVWKPRDMMSKPEQLAVTFAAGYTAGILCAVASHPSDTILSKLFKSGATISSVYKEIGFFGLWVGLGPRILMIGSIAAAQWLIYDAVKVGFNVPRPPPPEMPASLRQK